MRLSRVLPPANEPSSFGSCRFFVDIVADSVRVEAMLLHDSYFHSVNRSPNASVDGTIIVAYSPLFHSTFTLVVSVFGLVFNLICSAKICSALYQYRQRKTTNDAEHGSTAAPAIHILAHHKYRFLLVLTSNDSLLCLSSIISCLDERYFYQAFLARHQLCAAHILVWKFTLHFIPLLTIAVLCRYHYVLNKTFQVKSPNLSTLKQLLCTDLNILIAFVLAVAWSVDGMWLWGVANIKDYNKLPDGLNDEYAHLNSTMVATSTSATGDFLNGTVGEPHIVETNDEVEDGFLVQQKTICYFQTNHNFQFSLRLIHLIEADFLLLFALHAIGRTKAASGRSRARAVFFSRSCARAALASASVLLHRYTTSDVGIQSRAAALPLHSLHLHSHYANVAAVLLLSHPRLSLRHAVAFRQQ